MNFFEIGWFSAERLLGWLVVFSDTFSRNRLYHAMDGSDISLRAGEKYKNTNQQTTKNTRSLTCFGDNLLDLKRRHQRSLYCQSLGKYWQLNQNNWETEYTKPKMINTTKISLIKYKQEAQLMLTTGSTRLAVNQGQQTQYHSICYI